MRNPVTTNCLEQKANWLPILRYVARRENHLGVRCAQKDSGHRDLLMTMLNCIKMVIRMKNHVTILDAPGHIKVENQH